MRNSRDSNTWPILKDRVVISCYKVIDRLTDIKSLLAPRSYNNAVAAGRQARASFLRLFDSEKLPLKFFNHTAVFRCLGINPLIASRVEIITNFEPGSSLWFMGNLGMRLEWNQSFARPNIPCLGRVPLKAGGQVIYVEVLLLHEEFQTIIFPTLGQLFVGTW